jgi:hypothetical protein
VPDSSQITTVEAPISISESRAKPARATDRAVMAAMDRTTIPATFHANVAYSSAKPRRSSACRTWSSAAATAESCQPPLPEAVFVPAAVCTAAEPNGLIANDQQIYTRTMPAS